MLRLRQSYLSRGTESVARHSTTFNDLRFVSRIVGNLGASLDLTPEDVEVVEGVELPSVSDDPLLAGFVAEYGRTVSMEIAAEA